MGPPQHFKAITNCLFQVWVTNPFAEASNFLSLQLDAIGTIDFKVADQTKCNVLLAANQPRFVATIFGAGSIMICPGTTNQVKVELFDDVHHNQVKYKQCYSLRNDMHCVIYNMTEVDNQFIFFKNRLLTTDNIKRKIFSAFVKDIQLSWVDTQSHCQMHEGFLPVFTRRQHFDQFRHLMRSKTWQLKLILAFFIGLHRTQKVWYCLCFSRNLVSSEQCQTPSHTHKPSLTSSDS